MLHKRPELLAAALGTLLIGVTGFFRDPLVFEALRDAILPDLAARHGQPLRVWSAACSSGAELYSVAILLAEAGLLGRSVLLGTDCRAEAIAQAQAGCYDEELLLGLAPPLRERYCRPHGPRWQITLPAHGAITWKTANLLDGLEPGPWDLILFRNTAIYMAAPAVQHLWAQLAAALRPGGALVVGKAEYPATPTLRLVGRSIYRETAVGGAPHA